ncbi:family 16 glycosylhydrolase [Neolewinella lacunae]|uniref:Family 16 glycosylhydrolase n=1 Tax=Neolewinella lacunae TaxID=1517758 RepID=A0A923TA04_9BACT|nr:family 16 glycosylhydrolase [Neolewinella lacunae]MBC6996084.1 family 16 glycosylhydrolase [Neolewinella lacunae]MDN3633937.1 family 16 glycosylhydrolase [Neolewinella lacunae]
MKKPLLFFLNPFLLLLPLGLVNGWPVEAAPTQVDTVRPSSSTTTFDRLVWSDEFEGTGAIDTSKWFHQTRLPDGGSWYNGEIQHYTDRTDNSFLENGLMTIRAQRETYTNQGHTKQFTSARLNSRFAFTYGRVEVRAKLPRGIGTWPAIWTLGKNITETGAYWQTQGFGTTGWPACGEIDIMEHWGNNQNFVQSAIHTPSSFGNTVNHGGRSIPTVSNEFHVYALEWTAEQLVFSVDDVVHYTYRPAVRNASTWPFHAEQYLLLNFAIQPSIESSFQSGDLVFDYVRVFQEGTVATTPIDAASGIRIFPSPFRETLSGSIDFQFPLPAKASLYNVSGELVGTYRVESNDFTLSSLGHLPGGVYSLHLQLGNRNYSVQVVKE